MTDEKHRSTNVVHWEAAEIERSRSEASHVEVSSLRIHDTQRYMNPPANTPYPLEYCCHLLGDPRGKKVLDLGCGTGENTLLLALKGAEVFALDISPELIDLAKQRLQINNTPSDNVHFVVTSAHTLPLEDESIDTVFGIAILHHLDLRMTSSEVYRILKKGGRAIFQEPVRDSATIRFIRGLVPYTAPDVSPYERPLTSKELKEFAAPFPLFQSRAFDLPHVSVAGVLARNWIGWAHRTDRKILDAMPFLARYASVRVFEVVK
jgi:SAM-dependent methyltransferase